MTLALDRGLALLERLCGQPEGMPLTLLADELDIPRRRLPPPAGRVAAAGLCAPGAQPRATTSSPPSWRRWAWASSAAPASSTLPSRCWSGWPRRRANWCGWPSSTMTGWCGWPSRRARATGLRYDPDMGMDARLSCTASGHAWLLTLSDERAHRAGQPAGIRPSQGLRPEGANHGQGAAGLAAGRPCQGLCLDRRGVRAGHDGDGRAGGAGPAGGGRDQHRRPATTVDGGAHAAAGAGDAGGHGRTGADQPVSPRCSAGHRWASHDACRYRRRQAPPHHPRKTPPTAPTAGQPHPAPNNAHAGWPWRGHG